MCTTICSSVQVNGSAKGPQGWFPLAEATVAYDHPAHTGAAHALLIDFTNYSRGTQARVAVEMDLASGRALLEKLRTAIEKAEASGVTD